MSTNGNDEDSLSLRNTIDDAVKDANYAVGKFLKLQMKIADNSWATTDNAGVALKLIELHNNCMKNMYCIRNKLMKTFKPLLNEDDYDHCSKTILFTGQNETIGDKTLENGDGDEIDKKFPANAIAIDKIDFNTTNSTLCDKTGLFSFALSDSENDDLQTELIRPVVVDQCESEQIINKSSINECDVKEKENSATDLLPVILIDIPSKSAHSDENTDVIVNKDVDDKIADCDIKSEFLDDTLVLEENDENIEETCYATVPEATSEDKTIDEDANAKAEKEEDIKFLFAKDSDISSSSDDESVVVTDDLSMDSDYEKKRVDKSRLSLKKRNRKSDSSVTVSDLELENPSKKHKDDAISDVDSDLGSMSISLISEVESLHDDLSGTVDDILHDLSANSDDSMKESDSENGDEKKKTKTKVKKASKQNYISESEDEESASKMKSNWRNDSLLKTYLLTDDKKSKDCVDDKQKDSKNDEQNENTVREGSSKSMCVQSENDPKDKSDSEEAGTILKIEKELLMEVSSSSDDNDVKIVSTQRRSPIFINDSESDGENVTAIKRPGRRNIRAVLSDHNLEEASQRATIEEAERIKRLSSRNKRMENISSQSSIDDDEFVLDVDPEGDYKISVNKKLAYRLKKHQKDGVRFMWNNCYESIKELKKGPGTGCILAHTMGLGKSYQVVTLIHTLFEHKVTNTKNVLIVCPLSTVLNWVNEFKIAFNIVGEESFNLYYFGVFTNACKIRLIQKWHEDTKGLLILGYEAFERLLRDKPCVDDSYDKLQKALVDPGPDLVICDEGHVLKSRKSIRSIALAKVKTKRRIILTGTPIQNNLREYYYMVQYVKPNLLGSYLEYTNRFVNPITNGQYDDSTEADILFMKKRSHVLHKLLKNTVQRYEVSELQNYLPDKADYVLFIRLSPAQRALYKYYVDMFCMNEVQMRSRIFQHQYALQMICVHPYILEMKRNYDLKNKKTLTFEYQKEWWNNMVDKNEFDRFDFGPKLKVMFSIIEECEKVDDKVLIFSSSIFELNIVERFLNEHGTQNCKHWQKDVDYMRMDGNTTPIKRNEICNTFNNKDNKRARVLLVSLKVGGLGLNLVAANRVILIDVNWNPAYDSQSIFRTYRFGQDKKCVIYRLVALGTMEEVIYERSVTKLAVASRVVDEKQISRHYKSKELQEMFRCKEYPEVERPMLKVPDDKILAIVVQKHTKEIYQYHEHQSLLENKPGEELNAQEMQLAWDEFNKETAQPPMPPQPQPQQQQTQQAPQPSTSYVYNQTYNSYIPYNNYNNTNTQGGQLTGANVTLNNSSNNSHMIPTSNISTTSVSDINKNDTPTISTSVNNTMPNPIVSRSNIKPKNNTTEATPMSTNLNWISKKALPSRSQVVRSPKTTPRPLTETTKSTTKTTQLPEVSENVELLIPTKWIPSEQDSATHFPEEHSEEICFVKQYMLRDKRRRIGTVMARPSGTKRKHKGRSKNSKS